MDNGNLPATCSFLVGGPKKNLRVSSRMILDTIYCDIGG